MARLSFCLCIVSLGLLACPTMRADVIYDINLTSSQGNGQHAGTITLNQAPPATGTVIYQVANPPVYAGQTPGYDVTGFGLYGFGLPDLYSTPLITFTDGVPTLDLYVNEGFRSTGFYSFSVAGDNYTYSSITFPGGSIGSFPVYFSDAGTVAVFPAVVAASPEPESIALLGTGILALGLGVRRRATMGRPGTSTLR